LLFLAKMNHKMILDLLAKTAVRRMDERRKHKRRHTIFYIRVFDEKTGKMAGRLVDITTKGMMLVNEEPITPHSMYRLILPLPEEIRGIGEIVLNAKSVWCEPDINDNFYDAGFEFIEPSFEDIAMICNSFEEHIFTDNDMEKI